MSAWRDSVVMVWGMQWVWVGLEEGKVPKGPLWKKVTVWPLSQPPALVLSDGGQAKEGSGIPILGVAGAVLASWDGLRGFEAERPRNPSERIEGVAVTAVTALGHLMDISAMGIAFSTLRRCAEREGRRGECW